MLIIKQINFRSLLVDMNIDDKSSWDDVWKKIKDKSICNSLSEAKAESIFK